MKMESDLIKIKESLNRQIDNLKDKKEKSYT